MAGTDWSDELCILHSLAKFPLFAAVVDLLLISVTLTTAWHLASSSSSRLSKGQASLCLAICSEYGWLSDTCPWQRLQLNSTFPWFMIAISAVLFCVIITKNLDINSVNVSLLLLIWLRPFWWDTACQRKLLHFDLGSFQHISQYMGDNSWAVASVRISDNATCF